MNCDCCTAKTHMVHCGMCHSHRDFEKFMENGEPYHSGSIIRTTKQKGESK